MTMKAAKNSTFWLASVLASALLSLSAPAARAQEAIQAWAQFYSGPASGIDYPIALAIGPTGNVYVTGSSYGGDPVWGGTYDDQDWLTIAYSGTGVPLWTNRYNGPQNRADLAHAIAVDRDGNVVVTGSSLDASLYDHCVTIKYSSIGVPLWTRTYATSGTTGWKVAVDSAGNAFVLGDVRAGDEQNYLTLKYSSTGTLLWARTYNGPGKYDFPAALAIDPAGNVFVTGNSGGSTTLPDYATLKYSSTGELLWLRRYNGPCGWKGPGDGQDEAKALAVDHEGNVIVTGRSDGGTNIISYATLKYSSTGEPVWTNRYNGPANGDMATAVAVDANGGVIVTGESDGTSTDYATIKYSSAGVLLWTNRYSGPGTYLDRPVAVALDANGNVFVTGSSLDLGTPWDARYADVVTVAYSSGGAQLWTKRFNGPGNKDDSPAALGVDGNDNVYVLGASETSQSGGPSARDFDYALIKYVTPPIITRQPLSCTNAAGTTGSFTVEVAGSAPFSYQWRRDGTNLVDGGDISGVTATNLLIANAQPGDAVGYSVVITNAYGSVTSIVAQLTVVVPPNPGRFTNFSYSPIMGFNFIFRDATVGQSYKIQTSPTAAAGSWVDWESFTYSGPKGLMDVEAVAKTNKFYRAVSP